MGPTRTEADFGAHIPQPVATAPAAVRWHFGADPLHIPPSESWVRVVAAASGRELDLGENGPRGILPSLATRVAFLREA